MSLTFAYVTADNEEEAKKIGELAVKDGLAACVNIFTKGLSIYQWQGQINCDEEVYLLFKTKEEKFDALQKLIKEHHSFEVPCVLKIPISDGNKDYLNWLQEQLNRT